MPKSPEVIAGKSALQAPPARRRFSSVPERDSKKSANPGNQPVIKGSVPPFLNAPRRGWRGFNGLWTARLKQQRDTPFDDRIFQDGWNINFRGGGLDFQEKTDIMEFSKEVVMPVSLPELPYPKTALAPHISEETLNFHYGKHHKSYVDKLNGQIENTPWKTAPLEEIVKSSSGGIFNNSAQVWNHNFYWNSLSPAGRPAGRSADLNKALEKDFGSLEGFKKEFTAKALGQFGSGWAWLVKSDGALKVIATGNAETPVTSEKDTPLLTCDVWEHAYYVDYRNARNTYLEAFWNLVNWNFVSRNLDA